VASYRGRPRRFNLADLFELVAAAVPGRDAVVAGDRRRSFRALDARANRFANLVLSWALTPRARIGILSTNRVEWLEVMLGAFKARATPLGLRVDGSADETLAVLGSASAEVLVYEPHLSATVSAVAGQVPSLRHLLVLPVEPPGPAGSGRPGGPGGPGGAGASDGLEGGATGLVHPAGRSKLRHRVGATDYEAELAVRSEAVPGVDRSPDDLYMVDERPTGPFLAAPGVPGAAGVRGDPGAPAASTPPPPSLAAVWRHEDLFFTQLGGGRSDRIASPVSAPEELVERIRGDDDPLADVVTAPLAGRDAQRRVLTTLLAGGTVVLPGGDAGATDAATDAGDDRPGIAASNVP